MGISTGYRILKLLRFCPFFSAHAKAARLSAWGEVKPRNEGQPASYALADRRPAEQTRLLKPKVKDHRTRQPSRAEYSHGAQRALSFRWLKIRRSVIRLL
jgi:hypothetical protein